MKNDKSDTSKKPLAIAKISGNKTHPQISGLAEFYKTGSGVLTKVWVSGLPKSDSFCESPIFAMHIHSGSSCTGNETDNFANANSHYNPYNCRHPYHAGDMPPVFGVSGRGYTSFLSGRFSIEEIIGKTIIIHSRPDDFTTQPSGNSGEKIACGVITRV